MTETTRKPCLVCGIDCTALVAERDEWREAAGAEAEIADEFKAQLTHVKAQRDRQETRAEQWKNKAKVARRAAAANHEGLAHVKAERDELRNKLSYTLGLPELTQAKELLRRWLDIYDHGVGAYRLVADDTDAFLNPTEPEK